jgi:NAD(P)-dependent dehydrogenase (short-subunit alcohol dehydrogenase family)
VTAPGRLQSKAILVVGAGTLSLGGDPREERPVGNGRAIAVLAAREGAVVHCADLDPAAAAVTADWIRSEGGGAEVDTVDVADPDDCARVVALAAERAGGLDGVVCNVGVTSESRSIREVTPEEIDRIFATNTRAGFLLGKAALECLRPGGSIVLTGTTGAMAHFTGFPVYDASKAALFGLLRQLAVEGGPRGIRANMVLPGKMDTPNRRAAAKRSPPGLDRIPLGRLGSPWEVATTVVFLLSDEASYITGVSIPVDGGLLVRTG